MANKSSHEIAFQKIVAAADKELQALHPELKGRELSATDPADDALRKEWRTLLVKQAIQDQNELKRVLLSVTRLVMGGA